MQPHKVNRKTGPKEIKSAPGHKIQDPAIDPESRILVLYPASQLR
jgi:hypothetical protein